MNFSDQKLLGLAWLAVAAINIVLICFDIYLAETLLFVFILHIITSGISIYLAISFMNIHKLSYVRIDEDILFIRPGIYPYEKEIPLVSLNKWVEKEGYLHIYYGDGKSAKIHRHQLSHYDFVQLREKLS